MRKHKRLPASFLLVGWVLSFAVVSTAMAEIRSSNSPILRLRVGAGGGVATVIYEAGIPGDFGGLPGVTPEPVTVSTNSISGSSGSFTVRIVTDANARASAAAPFTGTFYYDSSSQMTCTTTSTCGSNSISFEKISWTVRDGDTHTTVFEFDGNAGLEFQEHTDFNPANGGTGNRRRNWYRYSYDNSELLPAGTYQGTVIVSGEGS